MLGQMFKAIASVIILIIVLIALAISTVTLGTLGVIGLLILGIGLFIIISHKAPLKIGATLAFIGFFIFIIGYMGWL